MVWMYSHTAFAIPNDFSTRKTDLHMSSLPIYLPFYKTTLIARWCYNAVSHSLAISLHHPEYASATDDCSTQLIASESKDHPPDPSSVSEYIPKAYPVGWAVCSEMCPSPKRPVVLVVHSHRHWSEGPQPLRELPLGSQPSAGDPNLGDFNPPLLKTPPLGPAPPAFTEQRLSSRGTFFSPTLRGFRCALGAGFSGTLTHLLPGAPLLVKRMP